MKDNTPRFPSPMNDHTTFTCSIVVFSKLGGPAGPSGGAGRQPPAVNADFQSASIFLSKYMELSEEDRKAIGHR